MQICIHPIATITNTFGLNGYVRLRPLSRYFENHIDKDKLLLGISSDKSEIIRLEFIAGTGKKRRFKFCGFNSENDAKKIVGKTLYAQTDSDDNINLISRSLIGYNIVTNDGSIVGDLVDVMWLPSNDAYVIKNDAKEYLIPIIPEVVGRIDHSKRRIFISPMDGLFD